MGLGALWRLLPRVTRVGVLRNLENPGVQVAINEVDAAARQLGLELQATDVRHARDIEPAFAALTKARVGSLIVLADTLLANHRDTIAGLATRHRLPMIGWNTSWTNAGALLSYGADNMHVQKEVVGYVDPILRGAKPGDLPFEQPTKFELVINMRTAKSLNLTIPPSLLLRADHVLE